MSEPYIYGKFLLDEHNLYFMEGYKITSNNKHIMFSEPGEYKVLLYIHNIDVSKHKYILYLYNSENMDQLYMKRYSHTNEIQHDSLILMVPDSKSITVDTFVPNGHIKVKMLIYKI